MRYVSFFVLLVFCCSIGCLSLDEVLRGKGAYFGELQERIESAEHQCDRLELAVAEETSPQRLAELALDRGMVLAQRENREFVKAEDNGMADEERADKDRDGVFELLGALLHFREL